MGMSTDNLLGDDNPLNVDNLFIPEAPPIPLEGIPQGRTPMDGVGEAAMKIAPYLIPGVTPLMATMNAMGVTNTPLLSAIMKNAPDLGFDGEEAGSGLEGFGSLRGAAAGQMYQDPYNFAIAPPEDY
jgi:hypothetical protein